MKKYDATLAPKVARAIKMIREEKGLSQEEVRRRGNFSAGYISKLENKGFQSPSLFNLIQVAKAMDVSLRYLLEKVDVISEEVTFEGCLMGEGLDQEDVKKIVEYKNLLQLQHNQSLKNNAG